MPMRLTLSAAACGLLLALVAPASAQSPSAPWPTKPVRLVVPFAPGATPDIIGRLIAEDIQSRHPGITVTVENKPGAGGNTGTDAVAKAAPDGTTIGISLGGPLAINTLLFSQLPYDPEKD